MAKRITSYSKLSKDKKEYINSLLNATELKIIEVNFKKGIIIDLEGEEFFVVLDTWPGFYIEKESERDLEEEEDDLEESLLEGNN
jgi:hypothetical protein|tara:strand:+ start:50 stop:304 length:255 start_codon:yes stop_codon:yes gene_type:complete